MKKQQLSRDILILTILTVATVFTWITLEVYQIFSKKEMPKDLEKQLMPLNPNLDNEVIEVLKERELFQWGEVTIPKITPIEEAPEEALEEEEKEEETPEETLEETTEGSEL